MVESRPGWRLGKVSRAATARILARTLPGAREVPGRLLQVLADLLAQGGGLQDPDMGQETLDPGLQLPARGHLEAQGHGAVGPVPQDLALVPDPLPDVARHLRAEDELHRLCLPPRDAEGAAGVLGDAEVGRDLERMVQDFDALDALHREGPHLAILWGARV